MCIGTAQVNTNSNAIHAIHYKDSVWSSQQLIVLTPSNLHPLALQLDLLFKNYSAMIEDTLIMPHSKIGQIVRA